MSEWRLGLIVSVGLTLCAAGSVGAQGQDRQMGGIGITVFDDIGYRGENATFRNDQPDLGTARFANRISSLQVAPGEVWEVCANANYRPPCQVFSGNESDLRRRSWNDRISSLRRVRGGGGGGGFPGPSPGRGRLVLYADERFRGQAVPINGPTPSLGSFNDKAESLRIESGVWEVCEDINFGKCRTVSRDMPNLNGLGLAKRVSSVRPSFGRGGGDGYPPAPLPQPVRLVLYDRERYRGTSRTFDAPMGALSGFGNRAQSIQVVGTWQLCDGPNFTGRCVTVSQNVPNLGTYGMNNRVSSARPLGR